TAQGLDERGRVVQGGGGLHPGLDRRRRVDAGEAPVGGAGLSPHQPLAFEPVHDAGDRAVRQADPGAEVLQTEALVLNERPEYADLRRGQAAAGDGRTDRTFQDSADGAEEAGDGFRLAQQFLSGLHDLGPRETDGGNKATSPPFTLYTTRRIQRIV